MPKAGKPSKLTYEDWYAPNVGLIKTITYEGDAGGPEMERVELIHFKLPASANAACPVQRQSPPAQTSSAAPPVRQTASSLQLLMRRRSVRDSALAVIGLQ